MPSEQAEAPAQTKRLAEKATIHESLRRVIVKNLDSVDLRGEGLVRAFEDHFAELEAAARADLAEPLLALSKIHHYSHGGRTLGLSEIAYEDCKAKTCVEVRGLLQHVRPERHQGTVEGSADDE